MLCRQCPCVINVIVIAGAHDPSQDIMAFFINIIYHVALVFDKHRPVNTQGHYETK